MKQLPHFEIPEMTGLGWIKHAFLTRRGGASSAPFDSLNVSHDNGDPEEQVLRNRRHIANAFDFDPGQLILLRQMHQDRILLLSEPQVALPSPLEYDAMITDVPNRFLGILTADCLPIFIVDPKQRVVAAVHAGRQGTALHIAAKVVRKMREEFGSQPQDLLIAMGPSIGPCCYEIDESAFLPEWTPFAQSRGKGKWMLDLSRVNVALMEAEGIRKEQISSIDLCTCCRHDLFFSYRRDGRTGRQLSFIGIV
jgi:polyphenol oxidase